MKIAIVGAGISGLRAAYLLSRAHDVEVFESDVRAGGHTRTIRRDGLALDTGFLVHNDRNYPLLTRLFGELGVTTQESEMSFSVTCPCGLEYSGRRPFAQPGRVGDRSFHRLLWEIGRWLRTARRSLAELGLRALDARALPGRAPVLGRVPAPLPRAAHRCALVDGARASARVSGCRGDPLLRQPRDARGSPLPLADRDRRCRHVRVGARDAARPAASRRARCSFPAARSGRRRDPHRRRRAPALRRGRRGDARRSGAPAARGSVAGGAQRARRVRVNAQRRDAPHGRVAPAGDGRRPRLVELPDGRRRQADDHLLPQPAPAAGDGPRLVRHAQRRRRRGARRRSHGLRASAVHRRRLRRLTPAGSYATGGLGGAALPGTESDHLASQGSLVYDRHHKLLIAVNAGSDAVSTFRVDGDALSLVNVVPSGGEFPASIAVHHDLVYVLNAGGTGTVQGFRIDDSGLAPIAGSARTLGLANTTPPFFLTSPGQVGFTPNGRQLLVTTKASTSSIDVFQVMRDGMLSSTFVANPSATPVPFAFTFAHGRLVSGEAGASSVTTYRLDQDGMLSDAKSQSDGQAALCWIQRVGRFFFVSNTASNTLSSFTVEGGQPALLAPVAATAEMGPIDLTSPNGTRFLYAETGILGTVDEFAVDAGGALTRIGTVSGLPPGTEGIAST